MIATLSGRLRQKLDDRIVLEVGGVGYEIFLPPSVMRQIDREEAGAKGAELAHYKIPRRVVFGPLPKTSTGKVQKYALRERAKAPSA